VALAPKETRAVDLPGSLEAAMFAGQLTSGTFVSLTVTVKLQVPVRPKESVAEQVTVVMPRGKVWGDIIIVLPIWQVGVSALPQASVALTEKGTDAEQLPGSLLTLMFEHVTVGATLDKNS